MLERRKKRVPGSDVELDPHRRINTEEFLLRRTRRVALALDRLLERLQRPALSDQALVWRLDGPLGPVALADAFVRDAKLAGESAFFLAELVLMLKRVQPSMIARGGIEEREVSRQLKRVIQTVRERAVGLLDGDVPAAMGQYVREAVGAPR
jgi:hypothetical protein